MSEGANFSLGNIPNLLLRDVEKVEDAVVAHHCYAPILLVEGDRLYPLVYLYLGQAQVAIEVLAHHF